MLRKLVENMQRKKERKKERVYALKTEDRHRRETGKIFRMLMEVEIRGD